MSLDLRDHEFLEAVAETFGGETARVASVLLEKARAAKMSKFGHLPPALEDDTAP